MTIPIVEVFGPTIQGEGPVAGRPTLFIRTGGCDYRCTWCDSLHAVLPAHRKEWTKLTWGQVMEEIMQRAKPPMLVTLSGGNPAIHAELGQVIDYGHEAEYTFAVETQGTIPVEWLARCDVVVLSPKPPSSGMKYSRDKLLACIAVATSGRRPNRTVALKIPIFTTEDLVFAEHVGKQFPELPLYLSVGNATPPADSAATKEFTSPWNRGEADIANLCASYAWLCDLVIQGGINAIVLPQLHVLAWGNRRGV